MDTIVDISKGQRVACLDVQGLVKGYNMKIVLTTANRITSVYSFVSKEGLDGR